MSERQNRYAQSVSSTTTREARAAAGGVRARVPFGMAIAGLAMLALWAPAAQADVVTAQDAEQVVRGWLNLDGNPLGATLGVVALMTGQWLLLPLIAFIPVSETLSVIIQVGYFKLTKRLYGQGRRIFKMAPLHHHFEMIGWSETHIAQRFWLVNLLSSMLGIALALL